MRHGRAPLGVVCSRPHPSLPGGHVISRKLGDTRGSRLGQLVADPSHPCYAIDPLDEVVLRTPVAAHSP